MDLLLSDDVRIIAAMNPEDSFDYQTIDMDPSSTKPFCMALYGSGLYAMD